MTKYSFRTDNFSSSVIVLRDGRAMEVRRTEKTVFAEGERQYWPSLDAWKATLPLDEGEVIETVRVPKKKRIEATNPVLLRFMERISPVTLGPYPSAGYMGPRAKLLISQKKYEEHVLTQFPAYMVGSKSHTDCLGRIAKLEAALAEVTAKGEADSPAFRPSGPGRWVTMASDGDLCCVRFNKEHNTIGYFRKSVSFPGDNPSLPDIILGFVPITDPEFPMWRVVSGREPVRIP